MKCQRSSGTPQRDPYKLRSDKTSSLRFTKKSFVRSMSCNTRDAAISAFPIINPLNQRCETHELYNVSHILYELNAVRGICKHSSAADPGLNTIQRITLIPIPGIHTRVYLYLYFVRYKFNVCLGKFPDSRAKSTVTSIDTEHLLEYWLTAVRMNGYEVLKINVISTRFFSLNFWVEKHNEYLYKIRKKIVLTTRL